MSALVQGGPCLRPMSAGMNRSLALCRRKWWKKNERILLKPGGTDLLEHACVRIQMGSSGLLQTLSDSGLTRALAFGSCICVGAEQPKHD